MQNGGYRVAVGAAVLSVLVVGVLRVVELSHGLTRDDVLTAAFTGLVTVTIGLLGGWHVRNGS